MVNVDFMLMSNKIHLKLTPLPCQNPASQLGLDLFTLHYTQI